MGTPRSLHRRWLSCGEKRTLSTSRIREARPQVLVGVDGTFEWGRRTAKEGSVFMQTPDGSVRSNTVTIR